jgi:putative hydrolase of the HAD superfamily
MTRQVDYRDILRQACHAAGLELTAPTRALIEDIYAERIRSKAAPFGRVEDAVLDMLEQLRTRGVRLGLISNCSVEEVTAWGTSELAPMFDEVVFSYQVGHLKPDAEIYLHACRRLDVPPVGAIFVGDGGSDELHGAARVGMRAYAARWFVNNWPEQARELADTATIGFARLEIPGAILSILEKP